MNNNINIEAIKEDLKNNIDIYVKNINEIDDEQAQRLAKKARKKITNCEQKLDDAAIEFTHFDFDNLDEKAVSEVEVATDNQEDQKPQSLLSSINKKKINKSTIGVKVRLTSLEKLDKLANEYGRSANNIVSLLFEGLYDKENKSLNYDIEEKEPTDAKSTSYILNSEIVEALDKLAKEKGYSRTELFNKILKDLTLKEIKNLEK